MDILERNLHENCLFTGGNQREIDRARAQARCVHPKKTQSQ